MYKLQGFLIVVVLYLAAISTAESKDWRGDGSLSARNLNQIVEAIEEDILKKESGDTIDADARDNMSDEDPENDVNNLEDAKSSGAPMSLNSDGQHDEQADDFYFTCKDLKGDAESGRNTISLPSGYHEVYCEMGINGGGYTFIPSELIAKLQQEDIKYLFTRSADVLLRISKPDGTQPYTIISQLYNTGGVSLQLSAHVGYQAPLNKQLGPYLFLGLLPASRGRNTGIQGFKSNKRRVSYRNCDKNANNHFVFYSNPRERAVSSYLRNNPVFERNGTAVNWRGTARRPNSNRRMPLNFFLLTEMHFGGCGCYTTSDRWLKARNPALGTAIGVR